MFPRFLSSVASPCSMQILRENRVQSVYSTRIRSEQFAKWDWRVGSGPACIHIHIYASRLQRCLLTLRTHKPTEMSPLELLKDLANNKVYGCHNPPLSCSLAKCVKHSRSLSACLSLFTLSLSPLPLSPSLSFPPSLFPSVYPPPSLSLCLPLFTPLPPSPPSLPVFLYTLSFSLSPSVYPPISLPLSVSSSAYHLSLFPSLSPSVYLISPSSSAYPLSLSLSLLLFTSISPSLHPRLSLSLSLPFPFSVCLSL